MPERAQMKRLESLQTEAGCRVILAAVLFENVNCLQCRPECLAQSSGRLARRVVRVEKLPEAIHKKRHLAPPIPMVPPSPRSSKFNTQQIRGVIQCYRRANGGDSAMERDRLAPRRSGVRGSSRAPESGAPCPQSASRSEHTTSSRCRFFPYILIRTPCVRSREGWGLSLSVVGNGSMLASYERDGWVQKRG